MRLVAAVAVLAILGGAAPALAQDGQAGEINGTWLTEGGTSRIRIAPCGGARCGTIVWAKAADARDAKNPDEAARSRPIVGIRMLTDVKPQGGAWTGQLYNPNDGRTYTGKIRVKSANEIELSGCVFGGLICRSQSWSRVN